MPQTALSNLGLNYEWNLSADGWKNGMDANLILADWAGQPWIVNRTTTAEPASPQVGDAYLLGATRTGTDWGSDSGSAAKSIAIYMNVPGLANDSKWMYLVPREGWRVYDRAANVWMFYNGTDWLAQAGTVRETAAASVSVLEADAGGTIALNHGGPAVLLIDAEGTQPFPIGGEVLVVNRHATAADVTDHASVTWLGADPTGSGVLAQGAFLRLRKVGSNQWLNAT